MTRSKIHAVMVNHNASDFTELAVRSLLASHNPSLEMRLTVFDNASTDDTSALELFLKSKNISFLQSGFDTNQPYCSHGEILQKFVAENQDCEYYLFLDHDVCFMEENVIHRLLKELDQAGNDVFGIGPRWADWSGTKEWGRTELAADRAKRIHPFCALIKNTDLFRKVTADFGFGQFNYEYANSLIRWETFELMTKVMYSHGLRYITSEALLMHLNGVSYSKEQKELHLPRCMELLKKSRKLNLSGSSRR